MVMHENKNAEGHTFLGNHDTDAFTRLKTIKLHAYRNSKSGGCSLKRSAIFDCLRQYKFNQKLVI
jgi:hypothetical protein